MYNFDSIETLFISDVHLGSRFSRSAPLLELLSQVSPRNLVMVGDIIDFNEVNSPKELDENAKAIIDRINNLSQKGTNVVYIQGNHDHKEELVKGVFSTRIKVTREWLYKSKIGDTFSVQHGDNFDSAPTKKPIIYWLGDRLYMIIQHIDSLLGAKKDSSFSLANTLKHAFPPARKYIENYVQEAFKNIKHDGIICGHIHQPGILKQAGKTYINCGDWVDSCSAALEMDCGQFSLIHWNGSDFTLSVRKRNKSQSETKLTPTRDAEAFKFFS